MHQLLPQFVGKCLELPLPGRLELRVPLIIREYHHVALVEAAALDQVLHVLHVVDAPAQFAALTKVVDADEKSFLRTLAVAEKTAAVV